VSPSIGRRQRMPLSDWRRRNFGFRTGSTAAWGEARGAPMPQTRATRDPRDCRCGDEEVGPSAPLRLDQRKNYGAQPSCRQRGAVGPCRNTRRTAYRCPYSGHLRRAQVPCPEARPKSPMACRGVSQLANRLDLGPIIAHSLILPRGGDTRPISLLGCYRQVIGAGACWPISPDFHSPPLQLSSAQPNSR
jgi:hypothetical protein